MLDRDIRLSVERELRRIHGEEPGTLYRHELGLCMGGTRVDVAAINGQITGCEIKSARDKLDRLSRQVELYDRVLDCAVLVVEGKHTEKASGLLPEHWGVWLATATADGTARLEVIRESSINSHVEPLAVAQLLWRAEAMDELRVRGKARGLSNKSRWYVWDRLVDELPLAELQLVTRERLKARREWPGGR